MCKAGHSLASASDSPSSQTDPVHPDPSKMDGHLVVDILTLCFVVVVAFLYFVFRTWQKRKAAAAAREAEEAAAAAAFLLNQVLMTRKRTTTATTKPRVKMSTSKCPSILEGLGCSELV